MSKPLCFIVMPFGKKKDANNVEINFDVVYHSLIEPAIVAADMQPIRADEETVNGIIHKPMYERLILCDYAVADLTTANANVFYELGIRHAVKPCTTITIFAEKSTLPFDVNFLRGLPYGYDPEKGLTNTQHDSAALTAKLLHAKDNKDVDSPVYQLVDGIQFQNSVAHEKTDIFRDKVKYDEEVEAKLRNARNTKGTKEEKAKAVDEVVSMLEPENEETGVLIDAMLSYRAVDNSKKTIAFIETMPAHVKQTVMVQEQLGFALNREGRSDEAIAVLEKVLKENGPSSETYGILGRVYKDLYDKAMEENNELLADGYLDKAIETYQKGFEADWRDAYPGINAVNLLEIRGDKAAIAKLAPVVEYAVVRKMQKKQPDYWDFATLLELSVIENNEAKAKDYLKKALACPLEKPWMLDTTIKTMKRLANNRKQRQEDSTLPEKITGFLEAQK